MPYEERVAIQFTWAKQPLMDVLITTRPKKISPVQVGFAKSNHGHGISSNLDCGVNAFMRLKTFGFTSTGKNAQMHTSRVGAQK